MSECPAVPEAVEWKMSSACDSGACVGVARRGEFVVIGNTGDSRAPVSRFTVKEWNAFVAGVKLGDFDDLALVLTGTVLAVAVGPGGWPPLSHPQPR
jgi:hypothetical protein